MQGAVRRVKAMRLLAASLDMAYAKEQRRLAEEAVRAAKAGSFCIPQGGSIGAGGIILDASGKPVLGADGQPLRVSDPRVPKGGSIGAGGVILDKHGKPVLSADGKPLIVGAGEDSLIPPGGSIGEGGIILDKDGKQVLGADGKPLRVSDPRVPKGGSIGAGGAILDASGKPVHGADGKPLYAATNSPPSLGAAPNPRETKVNLLQGMKLGESVDSMPEQIRRALEDNYMRVIDIFHQFDVCGTARLTVQPYTLHYIRTSPSSHL